MGRRVYHSELLPGAARTSSHASCACELARRTSGGFSTATTRVLLPQLRDKFRGSLIAKAKSICEKDTKDTPRTCAGGLRSLPGPQLPRADRNVQSIRPRGLRRALSGGRVSPVELVRRRGKLERGTSAKMEDIATLEALMDPVLTRLAFHSAAAARAGIPAILVSKFVPFSGNKNHRAPG